ncbi:2-oxo-4-hydroxy-4-carboxy-5-ureidoimidazoline decarboxylase [Pseudomonas sp. MDT1-16]|uniref:2-oxo-4-hydroxy-4-carboxy-5-ureidoimidazoline decarboxylase n=1 Tax=Pseudomonas sp. AL03 TaxID=3042230 RepID=UPI00249A40B3|nr:2-oxo-4-hydroxy-4-carboxy-5-ureidoimidazoline decarboxylase [Pseudomonas sp. AL03]MDI3272218.1 2-oxo-4-hydroxy-4-carboxy-5-ureidoimidazoline decarboxylase [Pseudomonas sp. AL03]
MSHFQTLKPSTLSRDAFVAAFADIYEHSPWVAEKAFDLGQASIDEIETLHQRMSDILLSADHESQLALINAHPDLAGKAAVQGQLTAASTQEQSGAGIHQCTAEEFSRFTELNDAYKAKFKFPFIMAVKGSNRHQILAAFETRIHNSADTEFKCALAEINKIALFRLLTL